MSKPVKYCDLDLPRWPGVYLIYQNKQNRRRIIYIGKTDNLQKRIRQHLSAGISGGSSVFRRKLRNCKKLEFGPDMQDWIEKNCLFAFVKITNADMCALVEALLIKYLRGGELLLNS